MPHSRPSSSLGSVMDAVGTGRGQLEGTHLMERHTRLHGSMSRVAWAAFLLLPAWLAAGSAAAEIDKPEQSILKIVIVQGDGSFNNIKRKLAQEPIVQVVDESGQPVQGAEVTFTLPFDGPGGQFANGKRASVIKTDAQGRAAAGTFVPNSNEGRFNIAIRAVAGSREGVAIISQSNTMAGGVYSADGVKPKSSKKYWLIAGVAGAATAGALAAKKGGGSTAATPAPVVIPVPPTSVSIGSISVGGPK
jgi:hypothetical protein